MASDETWWGQGASGWTRLPPGRCQGSGRGIGCPGVTRVRIVGTLLLISVIGAGREVSWVGVNQTSGLRLGDLRGRSGV